MLNPLEFAVPSWLTRVSPATQVVSEGQEKLEQRLEVGAERSLACGPGLGMGKRLEGSTAMACGPFDDALVHQEEENGGRMPKRHTGPVVRAAEIILEMEPDVTSRLFKERVQMLVIAMGPVVSKSPRPGFTELASQ
jgi:hypothetical protein